MTTREFYQQLRHIAPRFRWVGPTIRGVRKRGQPIQCCPVTAVALVITGRHYSMYNWMSAAEALGLRLTSAHRVVQAADSRYARDRNRLCRTVGLNQEGG